LHATIAHETTCYKIIACHMKPRLYNRYRKTAKAVELGLGC